MNLFVKVIFFYLILLSFCHAKIVEYDLKVDYKTINFTGKQVVSMSVNGSIPAPTLYFQKGDIANIKISNNLDEETSVHWHGVLLPNHQDGVPFVNHPPIPPGGSHLFEFKTKHTGTYWYHSHTGLQEQRGVYGAIVINEKHDEDSHEVDKEDVVVLSDWVNENPDEVMRTLKSGSDFYSIQKGSKQNVFSAIKNNGLATIFKQSLQRMPPMDISDVAYDEFLANGKPEYFIEASPGDKVKLRFVNAAAASYFNLQFAGGNMQIIAADGMKVQPVAINQFLMAVAETYDVIVTVPHQGQYELRATAQDGSGYSSIWIGNGKRISAPDKPKPNPYMKHDEKSQPMQMAGEHAGHHAMHAMHKMPQQNDSQTPYQKLHALKPTSLPLRNITREITLNLTGDMERYVWSIDNEILSAENSIKIRRGENIRFVLKNKTMMHHPMHLHGHFFRVLNGKKEYSPLKHTVDVPPMGQQIIEFEANEYQDWFFHCHILYHAKSGMARVVSYQDDEEDPEISSIRHKLYRDDGYFYASAAILSQMSDGLAVFRNSKNSLRTEWEVGWQNVPGTEYDVDATYERNFNRFLDAFIGMNFVNEHQRGIFGVRYVLPLNFESEWRVDTAGEFRITLGNSLQLTNAIDIYAEFEYDTETEEEWMVGINYSWLKNLKLVTQYHSDFGIGAGIKVVY